MQKIFLDINTINNISLESVYSYVNLKSTQNLPPYFLENAGSEHYKLLAYLASIINDTNNPYIDIGTYRGCSAAALSYNNNHSVITYDIIDCITDNEIFSIKNKENIKIKITDCCNEMLEICQSKLILLDIDPHDGIQESKIIDYLIDYNFNGILLIDDIHLNENMQNFWDSIKLKKYDITKYGHWSGTGVVIFNEKLFDIILL